MIIYRINNYNRIIALGPLDEAAKGAKNEAEKFQLIIRVYGVKKNEDMLSVFVKFLNLISDTDITSFKLVFYDDLVYADDDHWMKKLTGGARINISNQLLEFAFKKIE